MSSIYNQYDVNRQSSQTVQNIMQKITIAVFEAIKWIFNFAGLMFRQFMGK